MTCPRCQQDNPKESNFCTGCGARLVLSCASCGTDIQRDSRFCSHCGHGVGLVPAAWSRFSSPQSYTPKHLVEKILTSKSALEGERKQVTVLFADLKGSMEMFADRDPEEARKILDPMLELMMEAVHRFEGTVNQVMGDGIMALFGAPLAHEDHAVRACYAALRMQLSAKRYAEDVRRTAGLPIAIRIGLNSGEVVVRSVGSDLRMDYTAVGQTTHVAARMEQAALPGSTLLAPDTLRLAEGHIQVRALGPIPIKGLGEPFEVYELTGMGSARTRFQVMVSRGLSRFVGRDSELEQLEHALERAAASRGQVVAVVGEPGVGKSRLLWEFTHSPLAQGWLVLESGAVSYGKSTPYLPVTDLLKSYFRVGDADDGHEIREKVRGKLLALDRTLETTLPVFLTLLDVAVDDAQWQVADPLQRRQRTFDAVKRLLLRESQVQPVLVLFEDLHWIDSETQGLLDALVESLLGARVLLVVNYRPEYQHGWSAKTYYNQLSLDVLSPEHAADLLAALLGQEPGLDALKRGLITHTGGNALFLEESVHALIETKVLAGTRGHYRLARPVDAIQVPPSVQAVLAARIDRLPQQERRLLQAAAVVGKAVPYVLLQAIAELSEEELRQGLTHLQAAEFLYESRFFPDLEYTFKHSLTHDVAYASLLADRRRGLHVRIADAIERLYRDRLAEQVEQLAYHAFRGEEWEKAVIYLRQAGAKAALRSAHREAVVYFEQTLAALKHLPESRDTLELAIDLRFELRTALIPLGEYGRIIAYLREAEALAETLRDSRRLGRTYVYVTSYFREVGDYKGAIEYGQRALAIATSLGDLALQVPANHFLGQVWVDRGDYRQGSAFFRRNLESLVGELRHERLGLPYIPSVHTRTWLMRCLAELGEFAEGIELGEHSLLIAESEGHPFSLTSAYWGLGQLHLHRGDLVQAISLLERGFELSRLWSIRILLPSVAADLGSAYALSGRVTEALPLLEQACAQHDAIRKTAGLSFRLRSLSQAYLLAERLDDAAEHAERALLLSREYDERGIQAYTLRVLGQIAARVDPRAPAKAEASLLQALTLGEELGMRPLAACCHLDLGRLARGRGDHAKALEHLSVAHASFSTMRMPYWLGQGEAELRTLR
jgi:class 3 adenylate cyclase/tetratricopeptide (TPR) repeat protein